MHTVIFRRALAIALDHVCLTNSVKTYADNTYRCASWSQRTMLDCIVPCFLFMGLYMVHVEVGKTELKLKGASAGVNVAGAIAAVSDQIAESGRGQDET